MKEFFFVGNLESIVLSCFKYSLWKIGIDSFNLFQEFSLEIWNRGIQFVLKNSLWKIGIDRFHLFQEFSLEIWNREIQFVLKNSLWKFGIERFNLF